MTTFGEIVEPSSRNVWEDWDENNHNDNMVQISWQETVEEPSHIRTLLILEGKFLAQSIHQSRNLDLINSVTNIGLKLYKIKSANDYVCVLKDYDLVLSSDIVDLLKGYITISDEVIAILTKPLVEFHSSGEYFQNCIVRRLSTNTHSKDMFLKYPKLEQPNILSGASAGVICLREVLDQPASAVIFYIEQPEDDEMCELRELLQNLNISLFKQKPGGILDSNLYI